MAWCAARSFHLPAIDAGALRVKGQIAAGVGCVSFAGTNIWRSKPFACLAISTDASILSQPSLVIYWLLNFVLLYACSNVELYCSTCNLFFG